MKNVASLSNRLCLSACRSVSVCMINRHKETASVHRRCVMCVFVSLCISMSLVNSVSVSIYRLLYVCLFQSVRVPVILSVYVCPFLSESLSVCVLVCVSVCLSASVCLSIRLSVRQSVLVGDLFQSVQTVCLFSQCTLSQFVCHRCFLLTPSRPLPAPSIVPHPVS